MYKVMRYASALVFCFIIFIVAVHAFDGRHASFAWMPDMYIAETLSARQQGLEIRGQIPVILEDFGPAYAALNEEIESVVESLIEATRRTMARSIVFDYEIYSTNTVVSVVISATARAVTSRTSVRSVNFSPRTGALVTLTQAMGRDITPLAEGKIAEMIRLNPATYYPAFTAPPTGQAFYLTEDSLVLLFDEFQLSSVPGATSEIRFVLDNIREFTLPHYMYFICTENRYSIKMIQTRAVLEGIGYDVVWDCEDQGAVISLNGERIITLHCGVNNYQVNGVMHRSLEAAPIITRGHDDIDHMFVPISFFSQILGITAFDIDAQGNIIFMAYLE